MQPSLLRRTEDPTLEPVTLDQAKIQCRIDLEETAEDAYLTALITVAREWVEESTKRALLEQTWLAAYTCWPCDGIFELARPFTMAVESVKYRDVDGAEQTISASNYVTELNSVPGEVKLKCAYVKPTLSRDHQYPIQITFTAGYGETAADVPLKLSQAILMMVHHFYDNRLPAVTGTISTKIPLSVESLIQSVVRRNA
jgi:uncharacterized phiE125 gp8 family phage protein